MQILNNMNICHAETFLCGFKKKKKKFFVRFDLFQRGRWQKMSQILAKKEKKKRCRFEGMMTQIEDQVK